VFQPGEQVGDYQIVAQLKAGGMATLFLGRRRGASGFAKHVAIKVVHPHLAGDPAFVRMFVDEALLSARIQHPNVVHVEELRQNDGNYFLVMEYVHGCSLSQLVRTLGRKNRRLAPDIAVQIAARVADGLHAAHETRDPDGKPAGVVHRDVSPQNVLLAWQGHVKLIDFGVAKAHGRAQHTLGSSLKGKIRYMSPEQAHGRAVDRRTDVYALGLVLWEMLTMRRAFDAPNDLALLDQVRRPEIPAPSTFGPEISPALDAVVMRALATDPAKRWQTAQEMRRKMAEVMPHAVARDDSHLAELLRAVMADQIERERRTLPESLSGLAPAADAAADEAEVMTTLRTMTVSDAGIVLEEDDEAAGDTDPSQVEQQQTRMLQSEPSAGSVSVGPAVHTTARPPAAAAKAGVPKAVWIVAVAGVALMVAAAIGSVITIAALSGDEEDGAAVGGLPRVPPVVPGVVVPTTSPSPSPSTDTATNTDTAADTDTATDTATAADTATDTDRDPATDTATGPTQHITPTPGSPGTGRVVRPSPGRAARGTKRTTPLADEFGF
jgi:serine/threonine-protein kinase